MKRILVATVTALLIATAGVKAGPLIMSPAEKGSASMAETAQFGKKGKGFKKGFKKKGAGKKGPRCYNKCISEGKSGGQCNSRCR
jgi:hypothetical protein